MAEAIPSPTVARRCAVVTGANKGIGFEICKQLVENGVIVVMTARDEKRGLEALHKLKASHPIDDDDDDDDDDDLVLFHQLDVADPASVASLFDLVNTRFGKLDILINNAGVLGCVIEGDVLFAKQAIEEHCRRLGIYGYHRGEENEPKANGRLIETYELAKECLEINYYGAQRMTQTFLPLLQRSRNCPTIVNVSSLMGKLELLSNEWAINVLDNVENLTEEKIDEVINEFVNDFKEANLKAKDWPIQFSAYKLSKASMNAYTRIMAKKYPSVCINSICPGYVRTEMTGNTGQISAGEGAESVVKLALLLLPDNDERNRSGLYFLRHEPSSF